MGIKGLERMQCWFFLLKYMQKELYETILDVAAGKIEYEDLLQWVLDHRN